MVADLFFRSASKTHTGLVRRTNEDALLAMDGLRLWAVSDGMGGHAGGGTASGTIVERLGTLAVAAEDTTLEHRARIALTDANADLCDRNQNATPPSNMGATVALLGAEGARYFCFWAGDSRVYRLRGGTLTQLTRDHRYVQDLIDAGALSEAEALRHPQRNFVTRAVGIDRDLQLERCEGDVAPNDIFALVTDGVSGLCAQHEIAEILQTGHPQNAVDALAELCLHRGASDNFSLIVVAAHTA